jgi:hypothetical protein
MLKQKKMVFPVLLAASLIAIGATGGCRGIKLTRIIGCPTPRTMSSKRRLHMQDTLWMAVTVAFFAVSIGYVHFCERVK